MPVVVPVKFPFASRALWFDPQGLDIMEGDHAVCSTERGTELGLVLEDPYEVEERDLAAPLKPVLRIATDEDLDRADELVDRGEAAMSDFRRLVKQNGLDMKPVGVEYLFGGEKAVFYFAAEERVDFRQLVKDLSSFFHIRVDMRQIGVRDETRLAGGYAQCGQELCCTRFGGQFEPVSIRMAKEQDLPLNSSKISGVCGRLMCCLRYEFEAYKDFKSRAPKKKAVIDTPLGKAKIQEYDTPREQLVLRLESGKVFRVNLADMSCSDACKKRAEEQKCACRPDCVTRDVLEKIESPDIALALMELDREAGIDVGDGLSQADRIATSGPTPRRRRMREEAQKGASSGRAARSAGKAKGASAANEGAAPSRRRRKRAAAPEVQAAPARQEERTEGTSRRRRRHVSEEGAAPEQRASAQKRTPAANDDAPRRRSRRRHATQATKPDVPSVAEQVQEGEVKVTRRRPGDGGGAAAKARSQATDHADAAADQPQKRRRRRRSRKPKQDGSGQGTSSSAES